ncbi:hypothetical protein J2128_001446 [Methanomicrobium sp. W14]|uniref:hypothetical protein n=1 Tax=Methanomicrobium sp. W14 TaxID=2817839 RepID=UPI001AE1FE12|nr:hypothetical protein [Methanomicrobium sp. W14]MBP2133492.1 hypothetical protein [Methanomicrobium sp. W14]
MNFVISEDQDPKIVLCMSDPGKLKNDNIEIIKKAQDAGYLAVVITVNFPSSVLEKLYIKNGASKEKIYFIDAVSKFSMGSNAQENDHITYLKNPSDLTALSIVFSEFLKKNNDKNIFVILDSISSMLIYIQSIKVLQYLHFVSNGLRQTGKNAVFLAIENGLEPMFYSQILSIVDEVIKEEG